MDKIAQLPNYQITHLPNPSRLGIIQLINTKQLDNRVSHLTIETLGLGNVLNIS